MRIETSQEKDGRWIAELKDMPFSAFAYGATEEEAKSNMAEHALDYIQAQISSPSIHQHRANLASRYPWADWDAIKNGDLEDLP